MGAFDKHQLSFNAFIENKAELANHPQKYITEDYPDSVKNQLLKDMNCAAASGLDDFVCGFSFWNKMPVDAAVNLTLDTLLLGSKFGLDLMTNGQSTYIRKNVFRGKMIFKAGKVVAKAKEIQDFLENIRHVVDIVAGVATVYNEDNQPKAKEQISKIKTEVNALMTQCKNAGYSTEVCNSLFSETTKQLNNAVDDGSALIKRFKLIADVFNQEAISLALDLVDEGVIKPFTYADDTKMFKTIGRVSLTIGGNVPYVGAFADYAKSLSDANDEIEKNFKGKQGEYVKFSVEKNLKLASAMQQYQMAALEDTMKTAITADAKGTIIQQELFPESYVDRRVKNDVSYIYEAFKNQLSTIDDVNRLMKMIASFNKTFKNSRNLDGTYSYCTQSNPYLESLTIDPNYKMDGKCSNDKKSLERLFFTHKTQNFVVSITFNAKGGIEFITALGKNYDDVPHKNYYQPFISYLSRNGIIYWSNKFYPESPVTRGEFYSMYSLLNGATDLQYKKGDHWAKKYQTYLKIDMDEKKLDEPISVDEVVSLLNLKENVVMPAECKNKFSKIRYDKSTPFSPPPFKDCKVVSRGMVAALLVGKKDPVFYRKAGGRGI